MSIFCSAYVRALQTVAFVIFAKRGGGRSSHLSAYKNGRKIVTKRIFGTFNFQKVTKQAF